MTTSSTLDLYNLMAEKLSVLPSYTKIPKIINNEKPFIFYDYDTITISQNSTRVITSETIDLIKASLK